MPSAWNYYTPQDNFYVALPEGLLVSGANSASIGAAAPQSAALSIRLNGTTLLTKWDWMHEATLHDSARGYGVYYIVGLVWRGGSDPAVCAGDTIEFGITWTYVGGGTDATVWTSPQPYVPGGAPIKGIGGSGSGHDAMLDDILAAVQHTFPST